MKLNFIKEVIISIKDFEAYKLFLNKSIKKSLIYLLKLISILSVLIVVAMGYILFDFKNTIKYEFDQNIKELKFLDSNLSINSNEKMEFIYNKFLNIRVYVNTMPNYEYDRNNLGKNFDIEILVLQDKIVLNNMEQTEIFNYNEINIDKNEYTKNDIMKLFDSKYIYISFAVIIVISYIVILMLYYISIILDTLMLAVLGAITSRILKMKMSFYQLWNMSIHSMTLPIILYIVYIAFNLISGFEIKYFQIMYIAISYIYLVTSLLLLKTDCIIIEKHISKIKKDMQKEFEELEKDEISNQYKDNQEEHNEYNNEESEIEKISEINNENIKIENNKEEDKNTKGE